jgi:hypothetical protein
MEKKVIMFDLTGQELAAQISHSLKPLIKEQVNQVLQQRKEDESKPLSMGEAADYLNIGSTAFSNLVNRLNKGQVVLILCSLGIPELTKAGMPVIEL